MDVCYSGKAGRKSPGVEEIGPTDIGFYFVDGIMEGLEQGSEKMDNG